jgi:membrane associated rhomboid family serine protease
MKRFAPIITFTVVCWVVFVANNLILHGSLTRFGITPRHISSLPGILWSPFLHASFRHLAANTLPLLLLGAILCARSRAEFIIVTAGGILLGGVLTWLLARNACHVGASGLIFCYFGFLTSRAYFDRTFVTFLLAVICMAIYGGIMRGLLPTSGAISWESHVAGLIAGIVTARVITNRRRNAKPLGPDALMPLADGAASRLTLKN